MTVDLVQFLRARLDEDEAAAKAAKPGPWRVEEDTPSLTRWVVNEERTLEVGLGYVGNRTQGDAVHIARHDPARVLAEVDAKRQAVDACEYFLHDNEDGPDACAGAVLAALALPYASHPDYRSEWAP